MKRRVAGLMLTGVFLLTACSGSGQEGGNEPSGSQVIEPESAQASTSASEVSSRAAAVKDDKTIKFIDGVKDNTTNGDKYNYFALRGQAKDHDVVTAIIEGTAVDFRTTDNQWYFDYPYPGSNVETDITFTTDPNVEYGDTDITLDTLEPDSYVTVTFVPNENPTVEPPAVTVNEGEAHTFRNDSQGVVEKITVMRMEVVDADETLRPLGEQMLKVDLQYVNEGQTTTHIAPNYFTAATGNGHFLPLRYSHFWLQEVQPGQSFTETIYYDLTGEGPYSLQFFDGAWLDGENSSPNQI